MSLICVRRFFQQHPSSQSRYVRELYDALREATEARRTMRQMDKSYRPEIAGEIERTPENLAYGQLTRANKQMRAVSREIAQVAWAKSLPDVQKLVEQRARATRRPGLMLELHGKGAWNDIGALKAWLRDDLVGERNRYARSVVKDMAGKREIGRLSGGR